MDADLFMTCIWCIELFVRFCVGLLWGRILICINDTLPVFFEMMLCEDVKPLPQVPVSSKERKLQRYKMVFVASVKAG